MKRILLPAVLLLVSGVLHASAPRGILNVEIQSAGAVREFSAPRNVRSSSLVIPVKRRVKKDLGHSLSFRHSDELNGQWKKFTYSVTPTADGKCALIIGTAFNGKNKSHPYLHIDKVEFQGTTLKNPGFEQLDRKGIPLNWKGVKNASGNKKALEGKRYARVNFPGPVSQIFTVKKGRKVTISFYVRQENPLPYTRGKDGMTNIYTDCNGAKVHISSGRLTLIPSFENCSYYINRTKAEWDKKCTAKVWYRQKGSKTWTAALDPVNMPREKAWRGSIMLLKENTVYEFKAVISGEKSSELRREFKTRNSDFKIGRTIILDSKNFNGVLNKIVSGTPEGYTLYKAAPGFVLKGRKNHTGGVIECSKARFVIFDGLTIDAGGSRHGIVFSQCENMVVRNCDISNFGLFENVRDMKQQGRWTFKGKWMNYDGGIMLHGGKNQLIERCYIHAPHSTANAWIYSHPAGPSAVCVSYVKGGTVIRYNDFVGSDSKRWNDAIEGIGNGDINGGFGRDADIYGNLFAYSNDDSIELEGGEMNIRFYFNRVQGSLSGVSTGSCRLGPSYQFRNVYYKAGDENGYKSSFFKNGHGNQGDGALFLINNSVYAPDNNGGFNGFHWQPAATDPPLKLFTRNNIITTAASTGIESGLKRWNIDLDYDLFHSKDPAVRTNTMAAAGSSGQEKHALYADPRYCDPENGDLRLKKDSPARNRAVAVPGLPVKHLGAFQDDGIDIPHRPIPVELDRKEINFTPVTRNKIFRFTMKAGEKGFNSTFKVHCNDDFFTVTPSQGKLKSGQSVTFTVKLNDKALQTARLYNGMVVLRFAEGFSKVLSVYADFRNDELLKKANRKNLIFVKNLKRTGNTYHGTVTVPEKGCYFLFADVSQPIRSTRITASFGKIRNAGNARFSTIRPNLGLLYTGSFSAWYFFLDKGTYPFTFTGLGKDRKIENIFITSKPEEILR